MKARVICGAMLFLGLTACHVDTTDPRMIFIMSPDVDTVHVGEIIQFRAQPVVEDARWASSDTAVLSIDATAGLAIARAPGTATIDLTAPGFFPSLSGPIVVIGRVVTLLPTAPNAIPEVTVRFTAHVTGAGDTSVSYESSNPDVVSITQDGVATGHKAGMAIITARSNADPRAYATTLFTVVVPG